MIKTIETSTEDEKKSLELYNLLASHSSTFSIDDRLKAATLFVVEGNMKEVERKTGVGYETLKAWQRQAWWPVAMQEARLRHQDALDSKFTHLIHKTLDQIYDRVEKGDYTIKKMDPRSESL